MERSRNQNLEPIDRVGRVRTFARYVLSHIREPKAVETGHHPSAQIDVGRSARQAAACQTVIAGLNNQTGYAITDAYPPTETFLN